jgi:uncharacterized SAM-binding protein YcdF (DUF218 family)
LSHLVVKVLSQLVMPLGVGGLLILAGALAVAIRRATVGAGLTLAGLFWIYLWATPVFSDWVCLSLEGLFPPAAIESVPQADAIVVLGGGIEGAAPPRIFPDLSAAGDRVWHAARLYHSGKAPLVVVSGGGLPWTEDRGPEAEAMARFLTDLGVPRDKMLLEGRSATTYENARRTKLVLDAIGVGRVLLVTSARHMPRAEATFRAAGITVVPAPTDFEADTPSVRNLLDYLPDAGALNDSSKALKEYLGLWVYRRRGWAVPEPMDESDGSSHNASEQ